MKILYPVIGKLQLTPLFLHKVRAGFPSPADDYLEGGLDLTKHIIQHPSATYFVRAQGESMLSLGIWDGDLLVVDKSLDAIQGDVVIAAVDGELTCKVLDLRQRRLLSGNHQFAPITLPEDSSLIIEGVVTCSIRYHRCLR